MNESLPSAKERRLRIGSLIRARCPACHEGQVMEGVFSIRRRCPHCQYDFHPEPGFYMGAMAVSFLVIAMITIPPTIFLKVLDVDINFLIAFPFIEFLITGPIILIYCRVLWLHLEYQMTERLDGEQNQKQ